jgi:hypothetical protein
MITGELLFVLLIKQCILLYLNVRYVISISIAGILIENLLLVGVVESKILKSYWRKTPCDLV